jgi:hypothetical protein
MQLSMYQASVPVFAQMLSALGGVLGKAAAHAAARKIDHAVLLASRLALDMFPFSRQVQLASDFAKGATARLAGIEVPSWGDGERTLAELKDRVTRTLDYVQGFRPGQIDGSEAREIAIKVAGREVILKGQPYLLQFALPNFFFHATAAYAILRHNGIELGKRDFIGQVPGLTA